MKRTEKLLRQKKNLIYMAIVVITGSYAVGMNHQNWMITNDVYYNEEVEMI